MTSPAITCTPAAPAATSDFCRFDIASLPTHDTADYHAGETDNSIGQAAVFPQYPEVRYYIAFEENSVEYGRSPEFAPSTGGDYVFPNYLFPHAGTWSAVVRAVSDDSSVTAALVAVS